MVVFPLVVVPLVHEVQNMVVFPLVVVPLVQVRSMVVYPYPFPLVEDKVGNNVVEARNGYNDELLMNLD